MRSYGILGMVLLGAGALLCTDCSAQVAPKAAGLRPANAELYILSQSCFQGEVVPCG